MERLTWSTHFQNPEFLELTRMFLIHRDLRPLVRKWCCVRAGMRVLDVGCGTGYFTRLLAEGDARIEAVGVDLEEAFVAYARKEARRAGLDIDFLVGDALELPFEDGTFDLVASHTFLTSVPDPDRALSEMKRVAKPGALLASVTPMSFTPCALSMGHYPADLWWHEEFERLRMRLQRVYFELNPLENYTQGARPTDVPHLLVEHGLRDVRAYPLGKVFCLSNADVTPEERQRYADLFRASEEKKLAAFRELPEWGERVGDDECERYLELLGIWHAWQRESTDENAIWEWQGDANLLVTGRVEGTATGGAA